MSDCNHYWACAADSPLRCTKCGMPATHEYANAHPHVWGSSLNTAHSECTVTEETVLCSDCPTVGYPTDITRCTDCPRLRERSLERHGRMHGQSTTRFAEGAGSSPATPATLTLADGCWRKA